MKDIGRFKMWCVFGPFGNPLYWTVRDLKQTAIMAYLATYPDKNWKALKKAGFSINKVTVIISKYEI